MGRTMRTPMGQVFILGIVFLFVFSAYITIQAFASKLYGDTLGSNMELTLYAVFTAACFIAPAVTNVCGSRLTLFLGTTGYASLVAASLVLALLGHRPLTDTIVNLGGAGCGIGAALLWTAQGRLMLEYSNGANQGRIFAIFWALFNLSALVGGLLTFFYFADHNIEDQASLWPLYVVFLALIIGGGALTGLLSPPSEISSQLYLRDSAPIDAAPAVNGATHPVDRAALDWFSEAVATIQLFGTRTMLILGPLMWYTGFNQPYQLNTFARYFTARANGLEVIVFYGAEIFGAFLAGWILDRDPTRPRTGALHVLAVFLAVTTGGYALAFHSELNAARAAWPTCNVVPLDFTQTAIVGPTLAYFLWGLSDSQVQAFSYWLMRQLFADGPEQSRAVGFYKMIQSLGWCAGFALVPSERMPPIVQMGLTYACALVGVVFALFRLPSDAPLLRDSRAPLSGAERA